MKIGEEKAEIQLPEGFEEARGKEKNIWNGKKAAG